MADITELSTQLDSILASANLKDVTADGAGFPDLPDGYYLCELDKMELRATKATGLPMVSATFKVFEDGLKYETNPNNGEPMLVQAPGTKGRLIWINWVLSNGQQVERYASDMLKFEMDGAAILDKEYFTTTAMMQDAFEVIKGSTIYIMQQTVEKNGESNKRQNLIKWSRAKDLGLPM